MGDLADPPPPVVVEFKALRPGSHFQAGLYQLVGLVPLHSNWLMARCGQLLLSAAGEHSWECPLNPLQARAVEAMLDIGTVTVNLTQLPLDDSSDLAAARERYRAEFICLQLPLWEPQPALSALLAEEE